MGVFAFGESSALSEEERRVEWAACPERSRGADSMRYMYFVYMVQNGYEDLYVGITNNPRQRLAYHNENRGALFTKRESKFEIVFLESHPSLAAARKREIQIKKWRRDKKELLMSKYRGGLETKS